MTVKLYIFIKQRHRYSHWMTVRQRKRLYNKVWARLSRSNKKTADRSVVSNYNDVELISEGSAAENENTGHSYRLEMETTEMFSEEPLADSACEDDAIPTLREELSEWASMFQVKHNAVDSLLNILKRQGHSDLPSTARTLFDNSNKYEVQVSDGLEKISLNVADQLSKHLRRYPSAVTKQLQVVDISLNIDGLPLFKSSNKCLWPVLCSINVSPKCIFPLCLASTASKPKNTDFIYETIEELAKVLEDGLWWEGNNLKVQLRCITCDAPAKAMVKCIKQFSGYYGCDKCTQKGHWDGRMTYPQVDNLTLRTDQSFREGLQPEHHLQERISPFSILPIDMIKSFPADYMHQCCLGVMKKLLLLWTRGKTLHRMSPGDLACVSEHLEKIKSSIPDCFERKPRGLQEIERWKATEFRQFALYTGKIVLKGVLRDDLYEHFLTFSTDLCILVNPGLVQTHGSYAHQLLEYFVEKGRLLYGETFLVYNVHSLLHITADAQEFGCLENCSAFHFESYLHQIKKMVRSGKNVLSQITNRLEEISRMKLNSTEKELTMKRRNSIFIMTPEKCCEVVSQETQETVLCRVYTNLQPFLMTPCDSRLYGAYVTNTRQSKMLHVDKSSLQKRALMVEESHGNRIVLSILHSL
ncbi:hypothetical protein AMEX_G5823 [Astyanax mexicanus]|uniref:Transposase domain-containing protein n=1 Tax=Astyanax mexicanus TaxID=7994 RepID=A0A8T2M154_ASTMX|nr:hypothetical protein AMEX_G5823 [Astyanax mexicanus]